MNFIIADIAGLDLCPVAYLTTGICPLPVIHLSPYPLPVEIGPQSVACSLLRGRRAHSAIPRWRDRRTMNDRPG